MPKLFDAILDLRISESEMRWILDDLEDREGGGADSGRRSIRHRLCGLSVVMIPVTSGQRIAHHVWTRNVSRHGVAFLHVHLIPTGTLLRIMLPVGPSGEKVAKEAVVRRCRHLHGTIHEVGAEFCSFARERVRR